MVEGEGRLFSSVYMVFISTVTKELRFLWLKVNNIILVKNLC